MEVEDEDYQLYTHTHTHTWERFWFKCPCWFRSRFHFFCVCV